MEEAFEYLKLLPGMAPSTVDELSQLQVVGFRELQAVARSHGGDLTDLGRLRAQLATRAALQQQQRRQESSLEGARESDEGGDAPAAAPATATAAPASAMAPPALPAAAGAPAGAPYVRPPARSRSVRLLRSVHRQVGSVRGQLTEDEEMREMISEQSSRRLSHLQAASEASRLSQVSAAAMVAAMAERSKARSSVTARGEDDDAADDEEEDNELTDDAARPHEARPLPVGQTAAGYTTRSDGPRRGCFSATRTSRSAAGRRESTIASSVWGTARSCRGCGMCLTASRAAARRRRRRRRA